MRCYSIHKMHLGACEVLICELLISLLLVRFLRGNADAGHGSERKEEKNFNHFNLLRHLLRLISLINNFYAES